MPRLVPSALYTLTEPVVLMNEQQLQQRKPIGALVRSVSFVYADRTGGSDERTPIAAAKAD
jgi:hypothetical protein